MSSSVNETTLVIELNLGEFLETKVVRLEQGWKIHFILGESLLGKAIRLIVIDTDFDEIFPTSCGAVKSLDSNNFLVYDCNTFGAYKYQFYADTSPNSLPIGSGYFTILPHWRVGKDQKLLSVNGISVITFLTKLLGPLNEWEERLKIASECNFNFIHLTPVQQLGISNSSYSIAEHDKLNSLFESDFDGLESLIRKMETDWNILTIQDVVWNHAAKNASWLQTHPECAYNIFNTPHLRPAYILDRALQQFSKEISQGKWEIHGIPSLINSEIHLNSVFNVLKEEIFPKLKLEEFYQINRELILKNFEKEIKDFYSNKTLLKNTVKTLNDVVIIQDKEFRRLKSTVDINAAIEWALNKSSDLSECINLFNSHLINLNEQIKQTIDGHISSAIRAIIGHISYERVASHGPKKGLVNDSNPLLTSYFLQPPNFSSKTWEEDEILSYDSSLSPHIMAFNGWVMDCSDPLNNFAEFPSQTYLRRELICWGDSVKLKYEDKPEDCPFLWNYMENYTKKCAKIFNGLRIDNCHSTPIHVAEHLLKVARNVRKNLYVVAELFTGNEHLDNIFVNRLGITSLIREAQNAHNCNEQGRFVYRYGGDPVGAFHPKSIRPAPCDVAHALFYDQTHDNPSPIQKRTVYDCLPTAAMCSATCCATGTVRGYDEFFPKHINVVNETKLYHKWSKNNFKEGMFNARRILNDLHYKLWNDGYTQTFVDQINEDITAITRHNPTNNHSILLIANTCFSTFKWTPSNYKPIFVDGKIEKILFELKTVEKGENKDILSKNDENKENSPLNNLLTGLTNFTVECYENVQIDASDAIEIINNENNNGKQYIKFKLFTSGSVIVLKVNPTESTLKACNFIEDTIENNALTEETTNLLHSLTLYDFNFLLYRCESEELATIFSGAYQIPNFGKLPYCGLLGIRQLLKSIQERHDLGHPFCENLRQGTWIIEYSINRLKRFSPTLQQFAILLEHAFNPLKDFPHHLRPCYFEMIFTYFYLAIERAFLEKIFSQSPSLPRIRIVELLCIASNAFVAHIPNALLPPLANNKIGAVSLSAGLPHFAEGIWRNWGRDTFISLPGIFLLTGRFDDAKNCILAYAGTLRHGLIPNLLAEGKTPRYNCRDAVWFWIVAIIRYIEIVPDGFKILQEPVLRLYPTDDSTGDDLKSEPLHCTIYEALSRHFEGINFRERNAGHQIDEHMKDEGFNVQAFICPKTGLIFGGNRWNCGTWMDKMGSSLNAGNKGEPATPRDGAAVELQGLALRVAKAFDKYSNEGIFPYKELKNVSLGTSLSWSEWSLKIQKSFFEFFYVPETCTDKFVNRKGIIKDSFGSSLGYTDYQLRPNFCIALDVSPDLIDPNLAWNALEIAGNILALNAPLGICTLDPKDWAYNGYYNNSDDGTNKSTAKGWNYHQGPEWLWIACAYMCAKLKIASLLYKNGRKLEWHQTLDEIRCKLFKYENILINGDWASLPELTNAKGEKCEDSCPAQAWSVGYALEVIETMRKCQEEVGIYKL
ncbi:hypothetical protein ACQ4LE_006062 [Meloidogyne hapla]|uniref:Glycogen debranching enzyme n=1 Tax=Meloidogyne hapla TaxID=6305 RepID=A0A1I8BJS2_MELHA